MEKFYIYTILGSFLHLGINFTTALKRKDFKFWVFIKKNIPGNIIGTIAAIITVSVWIDIQSINIPKVGMIFEKINMNALLALLIGYTGDNILKNLVKLFNAAIKLITQGIFSKIGLLFNIKSNKNESNTKNN